MSALVYHLCYLTKKSKFAFKKSRVKNFLILSIEWFLRFIVIYVSLFEITYCFQDSSITIKNIL